MEDIVERLQHWAENNRLAEKAFEGCKVFLANSAEEDSQLGNVPLKGIAIEDINLVFDRQALIFTHGILSHPFIETHIGLYVDDPQAVHFRSLKPVGQYTLITNLNGQVEDDYLELE